MAILDSIKDPSTGQIKKPILYSLLGGGALFAYLLLKGGSGGTSSTGQTTALTPDLSGLQDAIKGLMGGAGASGANGGVASGGGATITTPTPTGDTPNAPVSTPTGYIAGSSGAAGGGGSGTGLVINPIAKSPQVYAGLTESQQTAISAVYAGLPAAPVPIVRQTEASGVLTSTLVPDAIEAAYINRAVGIVPTGSTYTAPKTTTVTPTTIKPTTTVSVAPRIPAPLPPRQPAAPIAS